MRRQRVQRMTPVAEFGRNVELVRVRMRAITIDGQFDKAR